MFDNDVHVYKNTTMAPPYILSNIPQEGNAVQNCLVFLPDPK